MPLQLDIQFRIGTGLWTTVAQIDLAAGVAGQFQEFDIPTYTFPSGESFNPYSDIPLIKPVLGDFSTVLMTTGLVDISAADTRGARFAMKTASGNFGNESGFCRLKPFPVSGNVWEVEAMVNAPRIGSGYMLSGLVLYSSVQNRLSYMGHCPMGEPNAGRYAEMQVNYAAGAAAWGFYGDVSRMLGLNSPIYWIRARRNGGDYSVHVSSDRFNWYEVTGGSGWVQAPTHIGFGVFGRLASQDLPPIGLRDKMGLIGLHLDVRNQLSD